MNSLLLTTLLLLTNWVNISGEIKKSDARNWDQAKVILTSNNVFLGESVLTEEGRYSIDYLVEGEAGYELRIVYNSLKDTVLLKEVVQFESQFEVWNFEM